MPIELTLFMLAMSAVWLSKAAPREMILGGAELRGMGFGLLAMAVGIGLSHSGAEPLFVVGAVVLTGISSGVVEMIETQSTLPA